MIIRLFEHRFWTDIDSARFLDDPKSVGIDAAAINGQTIYIANGCRDGELLADVVEALQRCGASKIQLGTLRCAGRVFRFVDADERKNRRPQR